MMDFKTTMGVISVVIGIVAYIPYYRDIFRGKTKPHIFSWIVWALAVGAVFFAQISEGAGSGAWATGVTALNCLAVVLLSFFYGEKDIQKIDWICFAAALFGVVLWKITGNPLYAVIIISITDVVGFIPTLRKGYKKPNEDTASMWALNSLKYVFALFALQSHNVAVWLYPATLVCSNAVFAFILYIRRKQLR